MLKPTEWTIWFIWSRPYVRLEKWSRLIKPLGYLFFQDCNIVVLIKNMKWVVKKLEASPKCIMALVFHFTKLDFLSCFSFINGNVACQLSSFHYSDLCFCSKLIKRGILLMFFLTCYNLIYNQCYQLPFKEKAHRRDDQLYPFMS